jgi:hypothetical protein
MIQSAFDLNNAMLIKEEKMPKYGRGLNRELVSAVNAGEIKEPFGTEDVRQLIALKKWDPPPTEAYINVTLSNASSEEHSLTYKKYFNALGGGQYRLRDEYRGSEWL